VRRAAATCWLSLSPSDSTMISAARMVSAHMVGRQSPNACCSTAASGTMKNWPNEPPAEQMPTASACLAGGATRSTTPSTGPKVAAERPMPTSTLPSSSMAPLCMVEVTTMPST
jgi:hypothetical protein